MSEGQACLGPRDCWPRLASNEPEEATTADDRKASGALLDRVIVGAGLLVWFMPALAAIAQAVRALTTGRIHFVRPPRDYLLATDPIAFWQGVGFWLIIAGLAGFLAWRYWQPKLFPAHDAAPEAWYRALIGAVRQNLAFIDDLYAQALALGAITVRSALGEPLRAEIEVPQISSEEAATLKASVGSPEAFSELEDLAKALGGAVASTRAVVDSGWYPYATQIGQTGKVVSPKLYIGAGVSGAIQHKVGMQSSQTIVSINKDGNAPIFEFSDFGVVGDLHEVVPKLTELVKERKG